MELNNPFEGLERLRRRINAPERSLSFDEAIAPLSDIEIEGVFLNNYNVGKLDGRFMI